MCLQTVCVHQATAQSAKVRTLLVCKVSPESCMAVGGRGCDTTAPAGVRSKTVFCPRGHGQQCSSRHCRGGDVERRHAADFCSSSTFYSGVFVNNSTSFQRGFCARLLQTMFFVLFFFPRARSSSIFVDSTRFVDGRERAPLFSSLPDSC